MYEKDLQNIREISEGVKLDLRKIKADIQNTEKTVNSAKESQKDPLKAFGHDMPNVMRDIEAAGPRWRGHKPIGPMGNLQYLDIKVFTSKLQMTPI